MAYITPEKHEQAASLDLLKRIGFCVERYNTGAIQADYKGKSRFIKFGFKGMPDLQGYIPIKKSRQRAAIPFFWEVKKKNGRLTPEQKEFISTAKNNGCFAGWGTFDTLCDELKREGYI